MTTLIPALLDQIIVRYLEPADADEYVKLEQDPEVRRFVNGPASKSEEVMRQDLRRYEPTTEFMAIAETETNAYIGRCGLLPDPLSLESEIYCLIAKTHWRHGIGRSVVPFLICHAISEGRIPIGIVDPGNSASQSLLKRLGFVSSGVIEAPGYQNGHLKYFLVAT